MQTIVLGRVEMTGIKETGKMVRFDGYNFRPETKSTPEAKALVWLLEGREADIASAKRFAGTEGYKVFLFPCDEKDPIGAAKKLILAE